MKRFGTLVCLLGCFALLPGLSYAEVHTTVFQGSIVLDGDISAFFDASGVVKPGVCVSNDPAPVIVGVPGSEGLGEPPLAPTTTKDGLFHPSGFNQRRVMSAYNPNVNGGTIYVGIDLPGGTGSLANPDYADSLIPVRGSIRPFDADANGEPESIGRTSGGAILRRCTDATAGDIVDTLNCEATDTGGFTDNPIDNGVGESYAVNLMFTNGVVVTVALIEDSFSGLGQARIQITQTAGKTFGAMASINGSGSPQGFDVEFAITNVNANVDACTRLFQIIGVDSGSNRDGVSNGEDHNDIECQYSLAPSAIVCDVLVLTNNTRVITNLCGNAAPLGIGLGDQVTFRVVVTADAANSQSISNYTIDIPGVGNVLVTTPLAPGQSATNTIGTFSCDMPGVNTFMANVTGVGDITATCVPIQTDCSVSLQCCGMPSVAVAKLIACLPGAGSCETLDAGAYGKSATGVKSATQDPAFCYKITVSNTGDVTLANLTVIDDVLDDLSASFADSLAPGASETHFFSASHSTDVMNTVLVQGEGAFGSGHVMASDNANAHVIQASISCLKRVSSPDDQDGNPNDSHVSLPANGSTHAVTYSVSVMAGNANLTGVTITDPSLGCSVPGPFSMAANTSTNITICTIPILCEVGDDTNTVALTAHVDTSSGVCGFDINQQPISVDSSCQAVVTCLPCPTCTITGPDAACTGTSGLVFTVNSSITAVINWSISGNGTIVGGTNGTTVTVNAGAIGSFTLTANVATNGCDNTCSKQVTVNPTPTVSAGPDQAKCPPLEGSTSFDLTGTASDGTPVWSVISSTGTANATIVDPNSLATTVNVTGTGSVTLRLTVTSNSTPPCGSATDELELTVNPSPACSITGPDVVCTGSSNTYSGPVGANLSYSWEIAGNGTILGSAATQTISVNAGAAGSFTLSLTVSNTLTGCSSTCSKQVTVNPNPTAVAGPDQVVCQALEGPTSFNLNGSGSNGSPSWGLVGTTGSAIASIVNGNTFTPTINVTGNGTITLRLTVTSSTPPACGNATDDLVLTVNPQPVCSIKGIDTLCQGESSEFCAPPGPLSYSWSGPGIVNANTQCITVSLPGTYTVTLTDSNGCTSSCSRTLIVNPIPPCTITGNLTFCLGETTQLCGPEGLASYTWSGPEQNGAQTPCITVGTSGDYTLRVTTTESCTNTCSVHVTVNPPPLCIITGNCMLCPGQISQLCAPPGMISYAWLGPDGLASSAQCIIVSNAGVASVTIVDASGCTNSCQHTVVVNPPPECKITGICEICEGSTTEFCAPTGMVAYAWMSPSGFLSTNRCVTISEPGPYMVLLVDENGCTNSCTRSLMVQPAVTCRIEGTCMVCNGTPTTICGTPGMISYLWHGPNNFTASTQCITITTPGPYSLDVVDDLSCTNSCAREVLGSDMQAPTCEIVGAGNVCEGGTITFSAVTSADPTFKWIVLGHGTIIGSATESNVTIEAGAQGSFQLLLQVESDGGCGSSCLRTITVDDCGGAPICPNCSINGTTAACFGETNSYSAACQTSPESFAWQVSGDAVIVGADNGATVDVQASGLGSYTVRLRSANSLCTNDALIGVNVADCQPMLTCSIAGLATVDAGTTNTYSVTTAAGASVTWLISGNGLIDGPTHGASVDVLALACLPPDTCAYEITALVALNNTTNFCSVVVQVNGPAGTTARVSRPVDFWKVHAQGGDANAVTLRRAIEAHGGTLDLGFITLPTRDRNHDGQVNAEDTLREAMGLLAKKPSTKSLRGARIGLASELVAAVANAELFQSDAAAQERMAHARSIAACSDSAAILSMRAELSQFNAAGSSRPVPAPLRETAPDLKGSLKLKASISPKLLSNVGNCGN